MAPFVEEGNLHYEIQSKSSNLDSLSSALSVNNSSQLQAGSDPGPECIAYCVHDLIYNHVKSQPQALAICAWDGSLTYQELDVVSSRVAQNLIQCGVSPQSSVPMCFEKSKWAVVAMLAIMKAGAAFVPLDPTQPVKRLQEISQEVEAQFVVISAKNADRLSSHFHQNVIILDNDLIRSLNEDVRITELPRICSDQSALVMFTSGSTSKPNGVVIQHCALATAARMHAFYYNITPKSRVAQFTAYIWMPCTTEILSTLMYGGQVCIPSDSERLNDPVGFMRDCEVTLAHLTPSFLGPVSPAEIPSLEVLGLGGEKVPKDMIERWSSSVKLIIGYGSTETNLALLQIVGAESRTYVDRSPGQSVCWIVEPGNCEQLATLGSEGELLIESWALARDYLNNPEKSAGTFIQTPQWLHRFRSGKPTRICRLGDLARYNQDGSIQILGRKDDVIKIRGQKVDVGEVENHIRRYLPSGTRIAVESSTRSGEGQDIALTAFLIINPRSDVNHAITKPPINALDLATQISNLKDALSQSLPSFMIPAFFVPVESLPLTLTGKLNRKELKLMASKVAADEFEVLLHTGSRRLPTTDVEKRLARSWSSLINVEEDLIGLESNFFAVGGNSIYAMRLVSEARAYGLTLTVEGIFKNPRLADMASICADGHSTLTEYSVPPFQLLGDLNAVETAKQEISMYCEVELVKIEDAYPPTGLQLGLIALSMKRPGDYLVRSSFVLPPSVDLKRFRESWNKLFQQCAIFRTRFVQSASGLLQVILREEAEWSTYINHDLWEEDFRQAVITEGQKLLRYAIEEDVNGESRFHFIIHHALIDAWSMERTIQTLERIYLGESLSTSPSYSQFIKYLSNPNMEMEKSYWIEQLKEVHPGQFPALPEPGYQPSPNCTLEQTITFVRPPELSITLPNILRASFAILLDWYLDTHDVVFGATLNGRSSDIQNIEAIIGPTIATVPVRVRVNHHQTLADFLLDIQKQAADMIPYEQIGLQNIRRLSPDAISAAGFQSLLIIQNASKDDFPGFLGQTVGVDMQNSWSTYALNLECSLTDQGAQLMLTFDSNIIPTNQMPHIVSQFENIVQQLCADQTITIGNLDRLSGPEMDKLLEWNKALPKPMDLCAHELYHAEAQLRPNSSAISSHDGDFTYKELDEIAMRLARYLVDSCKIRPDDIVPLCFEKSKWMIVCMLAVWKSGAGFAPVDMEYPEHWCGSIFDNVGAKVVLSSKSLTFLRPGVCNLVINGDFFETLPCNADSITDVSVSSRNICYVIHTSGTTGQPKGIVHEHQSYLSSALTRAPTMHRTESSRVLQFASYSFDISIDDIWTTLLTGGTVCVPSDYERKNDLAGYINRAQVTNAEFTPSLVRTLDPSSIPGLKVLSMSGEPSSSVDKRVWIDSVVLLDEYGPAEISIKSHSRRIEQDTEVGNIGECVTGFSWIVSPSDHNKLQPIGAVGELVLEGPMLARGYLNLDETTKRSFIQNPTWLPMEQYGVRRVYKTGDLARYRPDGTVKILGRADNQVKIRGQRVEFGHVEDQIRKVLPQQSGVVVDIISFRGGKSDGNLVVFVPINEMNSDNAGSELSTIASILRTQLLDRLPSYMIPDVLIPVQTIPTNISGKVDRGRLRAMSSVMEPDSFIYVSNALRTSDLAEPLNSVESILRDYWVQSLSIAASQIGRSSHFIHSGGDSIMAMKLVALLRRSQLDLDLTVAEVFQSPVLSDMAKVASRTRILNDTALSLPIARFALVKDDLQSLSGSQLEEQLAVAVGDGVMIQDAYPCSPLQAGIMALSVKDPGLYMVQIVCSLQDSVDVDRFRRACDTVYTLTPVLRTRVVQLKSLLLQVVCDSKITWNSAENLTDYLERDKQDPMATNSPLTRWAVVETSCQTLFVWSLHHAIYDGWSMALVLGAIKSVYLGGVNNWKPRVEFNVFIQYLESTVHRENCTSFWKSQLGNANDTDFSSFPTLPSGDYQPHANSSITHSISLQPWREGGFTISTLVRAAWSLVIAKHVDNHDVIFGTTLTGREIPVDGADEIIGPLFTTVPFRVKLEQSKPVSAFLLDIQNQVLALKDFQHFGLPSIKEACGKTNDSSLFQSILVIQPEGETFPGELFSKGEFSRGLSDFNPYAMMIQVTTGKNNILEVDVSFDSNIVDKLHMQRLAQQLQHVVTQFQQKQDATLQEIDVISPQDYEEILTWNQRLSMCAPTRNCIHDVIHNQALKQPDTVAITSWERDLSYSELDKLSARLAHHLLSYQVGPEVIVPLCFQKSFWTIVGMLAVLKAGGAFVLLDPGHPEERLRTIIQDVGASLILTSATLDSNFTYIKTIPVGDQLFNDIPAITNYPDNMVNPDNLACVIFTSGSTGTPKGINLSHSAICSSSQGHGPGLNMTKDSRVFQFCSYAFDMAVYDIITTLQMGGCVLVPSEEQKLNQLTETITAMRANWVFLTPSTLSIMCRDDVPTIETLVTGGEAVSKAIVNEWAGKVRLFQCSGPAETTTCIFGEMSLDTPKNKLGFPMIPAWIVDPQDHNVLLPIGAIGEMVLEGSTLARGYLNTISNAWIEDPAWSRGQSGALPCLKGPRRMYKSGDLVQYDSSGGLHFIGRKDNQVKLRGQRIEMGEVEDAIRRSSSNIVATVDVITPSGGNKVDTLAAFVHFLNDEGNVTNSDAILFLETSSRQKAILSDLMTSLSHTLPSYMTPSVIIPVRYMPLTTAGKLDRKLLKSLASQLSISSLASFSASATQRVVVPTSDVERRLSKAWAEVLNVSPGEIGAHDNFFRVGGNSITAMKLVAVGRVYNLSLTVGDIFSHPVLSSQATVCKSLDKSTTLTSVKCFELVGGEVSAKSIIDDVVETWGFSRDRILDVYPCSPLQEGLMALSVANPGSYVAQEIYRLPEDVDVNRFMDACRSVFQAHAILRTRIVQLQNSQLMQVILAEDDIPWFTGDSIDDYVAMPRDTMPLGKRLADWALINTSPKTFVWTKHHAIYDEYSLDLLIRAIGEVYSSVTLQTSPYFAPVGYNTFIRYLIQQDRDQSHEFWRNYLESSTRTNFPRRRGLHKDPNPDQCIPYDIQLVKDHKLDTTVPLLIRAAWAILLAKYTGSDDVVFGTVLSGRTAPIENVMSIAGPTFTTVPVRAKFPDNNIQIAHLVDEIRSDAAKAIPHEYFGLQNMMSINQDIRDTCDFDTLIVIESESRAEDSFLQPIGVTSQHTFRTYALTLDCQINTSGIHIKAYFDDSLITANQMKRLLGHFEAVLNNLNLGTKDMQLKDLSMMTACDDSQIWEWNSTPPPKVDDTIHGIIGEHMVTRSHCAAIQSWDGDLTYAELDMLSSRLATHLLNLGVSFETKVPLFFEKSMWTVVAMLGILRAGAAFVPLDVSNHPPSRLKALIRQVDGRNLVLTSETNHQFASTLSNNAFVVSLPSLSALPDLESWRLIEMRTNVPAYVHFTSGSTGTPKPVVVEHFAYCTSATAHIPKVRITSSSRVLQFASYSFDDCVMNILTTLMVGGCVCVPSELERGTDIAGAINRMNVNWAHLTPSVTKLIDPDHIPTLKTLLLGGEPVTAHHVQKWSHRLQLINVYGPCELCVMCAANDQSTVKEPADVGRAVGSVAWIVDANDHNRLAPIGVVGELVMEAHMMARGYHKQEALTSAVFLQAPGWLTKGHGTIPGRTGRVYKTGDLVRYGPQGSIVYVGRKDKQIKIRGQRIEIGEVDYQLKNNLDSQITDAAVDVIAAPNPDSPLKLVAFVCIKPAAENPESECYSSNDPRTAALIDGLERRLEDSLPTFMVPSMFIPLAKMPLNVSKKVDRRKLREIAIELFPRYMGAGTVNNEEDTTPMSALERQVQAIWAQVLNKPANSIKRRDNFLRIGGDSISAMQVLSKCRTIGINLTLPDLLKLRTLSVICAHIEGLRSSSMPAIAKPSDEVQSYLGLDGHATNGHVDEELGVSFPLSPIQACFFKIYPDGNSLYQLDQQLELAKSFTAEELRRALEAIISKHSMLRARFQHKGPNHWEQILTDDVAGSMDFQQYQDLTEDARAAITATARASVNIAKGPLMVVRLFSTPARQVLYLTVHHLVTDLISLRIIFQGLEQTLCGHAIEPETSVGLSFPMWSKQQATRAREHLEPEKVLPFQVGTPLLDYWGIDNPDTVFRTDYITKRVSFDKVASAALLNPKIDLIEQSPVDIFLSILAKSFTDVFQDRSLPTIFHVSHGRDLWDSNLDLFHTVGWFTANHPIPFSQTPPKNTLDWIDQVSSVRNSILHSGTDYFASRYLNANGIAAFKRHHFAEITVNYMGLYQQFERDDAIFKVMLDTRHGDEGQTAADVRHTSCFEFVIREVGGSIVFDITWDPALKYQDRILQWISKISTVAEEFIVEVKGSF